jgi:NAD(P)-dependent dehydrogenase (short-subunit alcohol dehydrogenase family)
MKNYKTMLNLEGKTAVVTGGGGELCGKMAEALAECGCNVAILDFDRARAERETERIIASGGKAIALKADVTSRESLEKAAAEFRKQCGKLDILINGAGGNAKEATAGPGQSFFDLPEKALRKVFDLNVLGTVLASQVFGKIIAETSQDGSIINISSMNAFRPLTRIAAYSAAKAAVSNFTQWLAVYLAQNGAGKIRVNAIAPGFFLTDQNRFLLTDQTGSLTDRGKKIIEHTPAARFGSSDDLISALIWLLLPESNFVNGTVVPVDGGFNAYSGV